MNRLGFLCLCLVLLIGPWAAAESQKPPLSLSPPSRDLQGTPPEIVPDEPRPDAAAPAVTESAADETSADITVEVSHWGKPVKDASVIIRGPNFDLVYDRTLEYKDVELWDARRAGKYIFRKVPFDEIYTLEIVANVKNRKYAVTRQFSVDDDNKVPGRSFKIQLEKSKEGAPPAPAPETSPRPPAA